MAQDWTKTIPESCGGLVHMGVRLYICGSKTTSVSYSPFLEGITILKRNARTLDIDNHTRYNFLVNSNYVSHYLSNRIKTSMLSDDFVVDSSFGRSIRNTQADFYYLNYMPTTYLYLFDTFARLHKFAFTTIQEARAEELKNWDTMLDALSVPDLALKTFSEVRV